MWKNQFKSKRSFKDKVAAPSSYQRIFFHFIQKLQLFSSFVAFVILAYFISKLRGSHIPVPWSFTIQFIVSVLSTAALSFEAIRNWPTAPPSNQNLIANGVLISLWALALGLLINSTKATMMTACSVQTWNNATGMMVCRLYKALFSFEIIAISMSIFAFAFVFFTLKTTTASGVYIRTANPNLAGVHEDDSEYRGLTAPSLAPSSAPSYQTSFRSPNTPDEQSLGFPSTPGSARFDKRCRVELLSTNSRATS